MSGQMPAAVRSRTHQKAIRSRKHRGFTIAEVIVVIALAMLSMAVALPAIQTAREAARKADCRQRMKRIGMALDQYHQTHSVFPYASSCSYPEHQRFTNVKHVWTEFLLPYLDETPLYQHINFSESVDSGGNRELLEGIGLPAYTCPSNPFTETFKTKVGVYFREWAVNHYGPGDGPTQGLHYPLCAGSILPDFIPPDCEAGQNSYCVSEPFQNGQPPRWWGPHLGKNPGVYNRGVTSIRRKDVLDGTSQTIAAGERNAEECSLGGVLSWNAPVFFTGQRINSSSRTTDPTDDFRNCGSSSHHEGGGHFLFVDGAVRFMSNRIDFKTYCYLGDKEDGHDVKPPNE